MPGKLIGAAIGAGYFSRFHQDAWRRIPEVELCAVCDLDASAAQAAASEFGIPRSYSSVQDMLDAEALDFVDIITPPATHMKLCSEVAARGLAIICQKALAPDLAQSRELVAHMEAADVPFMVHENFRFQPWHREIKRLLDSGVIGKRLHSISCRSRQGDGWGEDAYLARQPYFREMPQLLVYETGIHFIDTFRFLAGEIKSVYAQLKRLNPIIAGEDAGMLVFEFANGAAGLWDANRYNEASYANTRYTFGEFLIDADGGSIRLDGEGRLTVHPLGKSAYEHAYAHEDRGFAGDCVYFAQRHFVEQLLSGGEFETRGSEYLKSLAVQDAVYRAAAQRAAVDIDLSTI